MKIVVRFFPKIGNRINSLLNGCEIAASIFCHHKIPRLLPKTVSSKKQAVVWYIYSSLLRFCVFSSHNPLYTSWATAFCAFGLKMGIVVLSIRISLEFSGRQIHKIIIGNVCAAFGSKMFHRFFIQID